MLRLSSIILPESGVIQVFLPEKCSVFVVVTSRHFFFKIFKAKQLKALCINTQKQTTSFAYLLLIYTVFFLLVNHFSQRKFSFPDGSPGNGAFFIQKKIFIKKTRRSCFDKCPDAFCDSGFFQWEVLRPVASRWGMPHSFTFSASSRVNTGPSLHNRIPDPSTTH